jgi:Cu-Zn family superoxide dismutase
MIRIVLLLAVSTLLSACSSMSMRSPAASAALAPTQGSQVGGTVSFTQNGSVVVVEARVTGLAPGLHGFHIHEKGNCTAPDASSAGGHFNPGGATHGGPGGSPRHAGDLGNLQADSTGVANYRAEVTGISLGTGDDSIIGKAVIVHEKADDLSTQPTGNSGARLACGLISKSPDKWF